LSYHFLHTEDTSGVSHEGDAAMRERRYDIDWLRVIAMLTVFVFHCTRFFCNQDWHLKVPVDQQSELLDIIRFVLISSWNMELFFLLSGFAAWYSLQHRTGGYYLWQRVKRLLVPLYTVGLFVLLLPQRYFENLTHGAITSSFWHWLPTYYLAIPGELLSSWQPLRDPPFLLPYPFTGHLWFIQTLFVVSLFSLLVLLFLRSEGGKRFIGWLAGVTRPGGVFLFLIPLAVVQIALRWMHNAAGQDWAEFLWYALFYTYGYIIAADSRFTEGVKKVGWLCLPLWIGSFVILMWLALVFHYDPTLGRGFSLLYVVQIVGWSIATWSAIVFMLSLGAKYLTFSNKLLTYSNEAVLPFYLLHQTVILIVGWFVLSWNIPNLIRFLIILVVSFPAIMIIYEAFIRRIGFMRFLFGMSSR
jgi:peptidoglycan/LPS O-acetylase OafA/YrhL